MSLGTELDAFFLSEPPTFYFSRKIKPITVRRGKAESVREVADISKWNTHPVDVRSKLYIDDAFRTGDVDNIPPDG